MCVCTCTFFHEVLAHCQHWCWAPHFFNAPEISRSCAMACLLREHPSLGTWISRLVAPPGTCKINPVGKKHRFPKPWCCFHWPDSETCLWATWICLGQSETTQQSRGLVAPLCELHVPASWLMSAQALRMVFPAEPTFSWISKQWAWARSLHKGMDALGAWQELLTWHRKALAGLSLEQCHKPQVNPDPTAWTELCSEQLQASSTQQMNQNRSQHYLTRFILTVVYYIPIILSIVRKILFKYSWFSYWSPRFHLLPCWCTPALFPNLLCWRDRVLGGSSKCFDPHGAWSL